MRRPALLVLAALLAGWVPSTDSAAAGAAAPCTHRLLVLSALPAELDPLLAKATLTRMVVVRGRTFYLGRLEGNDVAMALSGIGLVNAGSTARIAFHRFRCGARRAISGVVFSGVAGGPWIGVVMVAQRWSEDGKRCVSVALTMFLAAD